MRNKTSRTLGAVTLISALLLCSFCIHTEAGNQSSGKSSSITNRHEVKSLVPAPGFSWHRTDTSVALKNRDRTVWQFNFNKEGDKPYFFPLQTAVGAYELASYRPADHPWHRGLWFSWKTINGVNYWEEDFNSRLSDGRSKIESVDLKLNKDFSAVINLKLAYAPQGKETVLQEDRTLFVSAPDSKGNYYMDWILKFQAASQPVTLDRTPPQKLGGPFYGGYAGLSFRAAENITKHKYRDSKGWNETGELVGRGDQAKWMDLSGVVDPATGTYAGVTMFDHPSNTYSPAPWYVYKDKQFAFMNAALLFDKPLSLSSSGKMQLIYRVLVHQDTLDADALKNEYARFMKRNPVQ